MASLTNTPPPAPHTEIGSWVLSGSQELRTLRGCLYEAITGRGLPPEGGLDEIPEKMVLVASELATNAIKHGLPPSIVRLLRADGSFVLDVADHDLNAPPEYADGREPGEGGLGLHLARDLALDIGWYLNGNGRTKHVWAKFPASAA